MASVTTSDASTQNPAKTGGKHRRSGLRFSLRALFVLVTLACLAAAWIGYLREQRRQGREAVTAINEVGHIAWRGARLSQWSGWENAALGEDVASQVDCVFADVTFWDGNAVHLSKLANVRCLDLGRTQVTDAGLAHLARLTNLEMLNLQHTEVTDAGIKRLQEARPKVEIFPPGDLRSTQY